MNLYPISTLIVTDWNFTTSGEEFHKMGGDPFWETDVVKVEWTIESETNVILGKIKIRQALKRFSEKTDKMSDLIISELEENNHIGFNGIN